MKKKIKNISRAIPLAVALGVILMAAAIAVTSAQAESPPIKIDCSFYNPDIFGDTSGSLHSRSSSIWRESTRKVAPKDIAWLVPGAVLQEPTANPLGASHIPAKESNFAVLGTGSGQLTASTDRRKLCIQLAKVASDHGANAIKYQIFNHDTQISVQFLRIRDAILQKVGRRQNPAQ